MVKRQLLAWFTFCTALPACGSILGINDLTYGEPDGGPSANATDGSSDGAEPLDGQSDTLAADGDAVDGGDGACGDVSANPLHCGRCGHSCLGGECKDSRCVPTLLAGSLGLVSSVAINATHVYFASFDDVVGRVPKVGGAVEPLAAKPSVNLPKRVAVTSTHFYWASSDLSNGAVVRCPISGCAGSPQVLSQPDEPTGLAVDATHVYWADHNGTTIARKPLSGGAIEPIANTAALPVSVAVAGPHAFWVEDFTGEVYRNQGPDGGSLYIGTNGTSGRDIAVDEAFVYWSAGEDYGDLGRINRAPRTGGGPSTLLVVAQGDPLTITIDATHVYWTAWQRLTDGGVVSAAVYRCEKTGCVTPTLVAADQDLPRGIAVDDTHVYWGGNGVVMKVAKP